MNIKHYAAYALLCSSACALAADGPKIIIHEDTKYDSPFDTKPMVKEQPKAVTPAIVFNPNYKVQAPTVQMVPISAIIEAKPEVVKPTKPETKAGVVMAPVKREVQPVKKEIKSAAPAATSTPVKKVEEPVVKEQTLVKPVESVVKLEPEKQRVEVSTDIKVEAKIESVSDTGTLPTEVSKWIPKLLDIGKYIGFLLMAALTLVAGAVGVRYAVKNFSFRRDPAYVNPWFKPGK